MKPVRFLLLSVIAVASLAVPATSTAQRSSFERFHSMSRPWAIPRPGGTHGELGRGSRTYRSQHPYMQRRQPLNSGFADGTDRSGEQLPQHLRRQKVSYPTSEQPGTIIVDTANTYLYLILGGGEAIRYGIGVGREGFTWAGRERVTRKAKWPQWSAASDAAT